MLFGGKCVWCDAGEGVGARWGGRHHAKIVAARRDH